jgi:hypothetical protein
MMTMEEQFPNRQTPIALQAARRVWPNQWKSFQPKAFAINNNNNIRKQLT